MASEYYDVAGVSKLIEKSDLTLALINKLNYQETLLEMTKNLSQDYKICYVSLTEPFDSLEAKLKGKKADLKHLFFIDCLSVLALQNLGKSVGSGSGSIRKKGVVYLSNPHALDLMMIEVNSVLINLKPNLIIFDSLNTLVSYTNRARVLLAVQNLTPSVKIVGCKMVLASSQEDTDQAFVKDLEMFVDRVVNLRAAAAP